MGITLRDIINLRQEAMRQNRLSHGMSVVITRKTAISLYDELFDNGLMKEVTFNEDEMCKRMHNSTLFGATIKVKGLS